MVSFNIASEASYVYILSGQKFIKMPKMVHFGKFLKTWRYSKISKDIQRYPKLSKDTWRYPKIFKDIKRYQNITKDIQRYLKIFEDIQRYSKISKDIRRYPNVEKIQKNSHATFEVTFKHCGSWSYFHNLHLSSLKTRKTHLGAIKSESLSVNRVLFGNVAIPIIISLKSPWNPWVGNWDIQGESKRKMSIDQTQRRLSKCIICPDVPQ